MKMRTCCLLLILSALATVAAAADIAIGQSTPLTGANADLGKDIRNGALAYFERVNAAGGVNGKQIKLLTLDGKNDIKISGEHTRKLLDENNVVALFGYASSKLSIPAMPFVKESRAPFFAPFTGADTIRKQNGFVYTVRATYADEIEKIINFWGSLGSTRVTVLHYDDTVGKEITRESLQRSLSALGRVDVGGHVIEFKSGFHHGGKFVDIAVILANGELRS